MINISWHFVEQTNRLIVHNKNITLVWRPWASGFLGFSPSSVFLWNTELCSFSSARSYLHHPVAAAVVGSGTHLFVGQMAYRALLCPCVWTPCSWSAVLSITLIWAHSYLISCFPVDALKGHFILFGRSGREHALKLHEPLLVVFDFIPTSGCQDKFCWIWILISLK